MSSSRIAQAVAPPLLLAQHRLRLDSIRILLAKARNGVTGQAPEPGWLTWVGRQ